MLNNFAKTKVPPADSDRRTTPTKSDSGLGWLREAKVVEREERTLWSKITTGPVKNKYKIY